EGIYYTPPYVVKFLVEGTLGRLVTQIRDEAERYLYNKDYLNAQTAIEKLQLIKVLDLACGSGPFLIAAYEVLLKAYQSWNKLLNRVLEKDFNNNFVDFYTQTKLEYRSNLGEL